MFVLEIFDCTIYNQIRKSKERILIQIVLHYRRKFNKVNERKKTKNSRITKYVSSNKNIWPLVDSQF